MKNTSLKKRNLKILFSIAFCISLNLLSHGKVGSIEEIYNEERKIVFPDTKNYHVVVSDLHTHSVFSDGHVWPNLRVAEALLDGLDLIAITEHLELQPHKSDIPHPDRNRAFDIANKASKSSNLIVINGTEVTRKFPPGHINAVFIKDANKMIKIDRTKQDEVNDYIKSLPEDLIENYKNDAWLNDGVLAALWPIKETLEEARKQEAFAFWNHPAWSSEKENSKKILHDIHIELFNEGLLHGIEVVNGKWFSKEAFQIALDYDLTIIGTSDVHGLIDWDYLQKPNGHRSVTLILSKERTEQSIKESLFSGRTVVWYKNELIGLEKNVNELIEACLSIKKTSFKGKTNVLLVEIQNISDVEFLLQVNDDKSIEDNANIFKVLPNSVTSIEVGNSSSKKIELNLNVLNAHISPNVNANIKLAN